MPDAFMGSYGFPKLFYRSSNEEERKVGKKERRKRRMKRGRKVLILTVTSLSVTVACEGRSGRAVIKV